MPCGKAAGGSPEPIAMSAAYFLEIKKFDGPKDLRSEIECFQLGNRHGVRSGGGSEGSGAIKVELDAAMVTRKLDGSSAIFLRYCANGNHIPEVTVTLEGSSGKDGSFRRATYITKDVIVGMYQPGDPIELFQLEFKEVEYSNTFVAGKK